ncbi:MAG: type II toxin-antitoxin system PemK/MazF family toxin [Leptolyngbyaceae cyanobacterium]
MSTPKRGEIWLVNLNPTKGQEIQKTRPVVVISSDVYQPIALRIVIPITTWQEKFIARPFMVKILPTSENGLDRDSAGNVLQVRSVSTERFVRQIGRIENECLKELLAGLVICVEYDPDA